VYVPGERGDVPLLHWYAQLAASGDLTRLLGPSIYSMAAFMAHFTSPSANLYYIEDEKGWMAAAWVFPFLGGGTWGLWVREDKRSSGSRQILDLIMETLEDCFSAYPVLVNTTKQPDIVAKTCRLGYKYIGVIPYLFEGDECHVMYMTKEMFAPALARWKELRGIS
jgi:hypothetical protein